MESMLKQIEANLESAQNSASQADQAAKQAHGFATDADAAKKQAESAIKAASSAAMEAGAHAIAAKSSADDARNWSVKRVAILLVGFVGLSSLGAIFSAYLTIKAYLGTAAAKVATDEIEKFKLQAEVDAREISRQKLALGAVVTDIKFFVAEARIETDQPKSDLKVSFPEPVDAVTLYALPDDIDQLYRLRVDPQSGPQKDHVVSVERVTSRPLPRNWAPSVKLLGIQIKRAGS